jgi:hypothetical protein
MDPITVRFFNTVEPRSRGASRWGYDVGFIDKLLTVAAPPAFGSTLQAAAFIVSAVQVSHS